MATGLIHMVYFWGRDNGTPDDSENIARGCYKNLTNIPGVLRLDVGFPAESKRDVVDNTYAAALLVEFADAEAEEVYQTHPDHLRFIDECKQYWSKVRVYDSVVYKP